MKVELLELTNLSESNINFLKSVENWYEINNLNIQEDEIEINHINEKINLLHETLKLKQKNVEINKIYAKYYLASINEWIEKQNKLIENEQTN